MSRHDISDEQWEIIAPYLKIKHNDPRGQPSKDSRQMLNGSLWILRIGAHEEIFQANMARVKRFIKELLDGHNYRSGTSCLKN
jgi:transposase